MDVSASIYPAIPDGCVGAEFPMRNQRRNASPPNTVNCTVRKYLIVREIEKLMDYARKHSRYGHRDATISWSPNRHGLRASEVCEISRQRNQEILVHRVKNGTPSVHPIRGDEIRALRKLRRSYPTVLGEALSQKKFWYGSVF
jgi:integrase